MSRRTIATSVRAIALLLLAAATCDRPDVAPAAYSGPCMVVVVVVVLLLLAVLLPLPRRL